MVSQLKKILVCLAAATSSLHAIDIKHKTYNWLLCSYKNGKVAPREHLIVEINIDFIQKSNQRDPHKRLSEILSTIENMPTHISIYFKNIGVADKRALAQLYAVISSYERKKWRYYNFKPVMEYFSSFQPDVQPTSLSKYIFRYLR